MPRPCCHPQMAKRSPPPPLSSCPSQPLPRACGASCLGAASRGSAHSAIATRSTPCPLQNSSEAFARARGCRARCVWLRGVREFP
eukprot:11529154-Alexandrium_andersonii.AAC.1